MKRIILSLGFLMGVSLTNAQGIVPTISNPLQKTTYAQNMPPFTPVAQIDVFQGFYSFIGLGMTPADSSHNAGDPFGNFIWADNIGHFMATPKASITWPFTTLTSLPTTLGGYGITDAYPLSGNPLNFLPAVGNGHLLTGLTKTQVGLSNVDNTSDVTKNAATVTLTNKTISTSTNTISGLTNSNLTGTAGISDANISSASTWNAKQNALTAGVDYLAPAGNGSSLSSLTKSQVGLVNVDNTSDLSKPISTATQTALDGKFNNPTGSTSQVILGNGTLGSFPSFTLTPSSIVSTARSLNTAYQESSTKYVDVRVSTSILCTLSLTGGQDGSIFLEYSADGSTNWTFAGQSRTSNTGSLTLGLNTSQAGASQISVLLPPGYYWRLRTVNTTGTPTFAFLGGFLVTYN